MTDITQANQPTGMSFIYHIDDDCFTYIDKKTSKLPGFNKAGSKLADAVALTYAEDRKFLSAFVKNVLKGKTKPFIDCRLKIKEEERWFRFSVILFSQPSGRYIIGNMADITAEYHNMTSLHSFTNRKNSILQILSHDLRGPLGVAKLVSQLAKRENIDERINGYLETISTVIQQSIDLIKDLTNREFIETVEVDLIKKRIDIAVKLKEYTEELRNSELIAKRNFSFESSAESIYMMLDEAKFMQVMNNLVTNALKFTNDNGNISCYIEEKEDTVLFIFKDDGIGIPEALQAELFKAKTKAGRTGLHGEPSNGVGLYVVKTIIDWHHGSIWFKSVENKGTTFYIELPKL